MGPVYTPPLVAVGIEPSVVKRIVAPGVAVEIDTSTGALKRPRPGENLVSATRSAPSAGELAAPGVGLKRLALAPVSSIAPYEISAACEGN